MDARYFVQRILTSVLVAVLVSIVVFVIARQLPGDAAAAIAGPDAPPEVVEVIREDLNLDEPLPVQYVLWLGDVLQGDLGRSSRQVNLPVTDLLEDRIPVTLELAALAMIISAIISVPSAIISATRPGTIADSVVSILAIMGSAVPTIVLSFVFIYLIALQADLLPTSGYVRPGEDLVEHFKSMLLPSLTLGLHLAAVQMRLLRATLMDVLRNDYVRTAWAKGLPERKVVGTHALRNAILPFVTIFGIQTGHLLGGTVIVETIFAMPGLGKLAVDSIFARDYTTLQGVVLVIVTGFLIINLLVDLSYGFLDPRMRAASR